MCNIFINVNKVQNTCTFRCNLIFIIVCSRGPTNFCRSCKNVVHFFKPNPLASKCACFTFCLLILVLCPSHFVNFAPTLFECTFRNHGPNFIKLIDNLHPITLLKTLFFDCQPSLLIKVKELSDLNIFLLSLTRHICVF